MNQTSVQQTAGKTAWHCGTCALWSADWLICDKVVRINLTYRIP